LKELMISLPPLGEQRRIATILDKADALRHKRRAVLQKLDSLTQSLFLAMFGDLSSGERRWEIIQLGKMCSVLGGKRLPKGEDYSVVPTAYRYLRVTDFMSGRVNPGQLLFLKPEVQHKIKRYTVSKGDIAISIAGTIGRVAEIDGEVHGSNLTENAARLTPLSPQKPYNSTFLVEAMRTPFVQSQIRAQTGQVTIGKLALFRIKQVRVPVPPLELQNAFARALGAMLSHAQRLERSASYLDGLFNSLQQRAFRGEL
jgi:type I restriction enzyme, S subunit